MIFSKFVLNMSHPSYVAGLYPWRHEVLNFRNGAQKVEFYEFLVFDLENVLDYMFSGDGSLQPDGLTKLDNLFKYSISFSNL